VGQLVATDVDEAFERALADLPYDRWRVIDTRVGNGLRADFVVVGPPGVFVIGCAVPHAPERARAKQLMGLLDAAHQVGRAAGVRPDQVHPVLCLTGDQSGDSWNRGVTVCGIVNLADTLSFKRHRLRHRAVQVAARAVDEALGTSTQRA
jgi:hypothetical protein